MRFYAAIEPIRPNTRGAPAAIDTGSGCQVELLNLRATAASTGRISTFSDSFGRRRPHLLHGDLYRCLGAKARAGRPPRIARPTAEDGVATAPVWCTSLGCGPTVRRISVRERRHPANLRRSPESVREDAGGVVRGPSSRRCAEVHAANRRSAAQSSSGVTSIRVRLAMAANAGCSVTRYRSGNRTAAGLWHGFITDVTERRQRDAGDRGCPTLLQSVLDAATERRNHCNRRMGPHHRINSGAERMLQYKAAEMSDAPTLWPYTSRAR